MTKYLLLILFPLTLLAQTSQGLWEIISPEPIYEQPSGIYMFNNSKGVIFCLDGAAYFTNDNFAAFSKTTIPYNNINNIVFFNDNDGVALHGNNDLITTTDGGYTWNQLSNPTSYAISNFSFFNKDEGFIKANGKVFKTINGGTEWTQLSIPGISSINGFKFVSPTLGWTSSTNKIFRTTDGGTSWNIILNTVSTDIPILAFADSLNGIAYIKRNGLTEVVRTSDGGTTWNTIITPQNVTFENVGYKNSTILLTMYSSCTVSYDNGISWSSFYRPNFQPGTAYYKLQLFYLSDSTFYAAGGTGIIKRSTDNGRTWIDLGSKPGGDYKINFTPDGFGYTATFYKSSNNGLNWFYQNSSMRQYTDFYFLNSQKGYVTSSGNLYVTLDGGLAYSIDTNFVKPNNTSARKIYFYNDSLGLVTQINFQPDQLFYQEVRLTTNGGISWGLPYMIAPVMSEPAPKVILFTSKNIGFISSGEWEMALRTTDGGNSWHDNQFALSRGMFFLNTYQGFSVVENMLIKTTDAGSNFTIIGAALQHFTQGLFFLDSLNGWAGTFYGIMRTTDGGYSWSNETTVGTINDIKRNGNFLYALVRGGKKIKRSLDEFIPVELLTFSGTVQGNKVRLNWSTATETNNKGFTLQRKCSGTDFADIAFIPGKINSTVKSDYEFTDSPFKGKFIYRLMQTDLSGFSSYSQNIEVNFNADEFILHQNYPNPFNPNTTIKFQLTDDTDITLKVFNILGQTVKELAKGFYKAGSYDIKLDATNLSSGIYFYELNGNSFHLRKKMMLQK